MTSRYLAPLSAASVDDASGTGVERFTPIEGLRAWLAWGVVLGHIVLFAGLNRIGIPAGAGEISTVCVEIFIILSGFVIAHLLLTRNEPYLPYIARRFFRLYPAFLVCAAVGAGTIAVSRTPWPGDPTYQYGGQLAALQQTQAQQFLAHVMFHLTMLHGMVSNSILNVSQWALLPPAWSVSLEWQFYLVAPAVMLACRRKGGAVAVGLLTIAGLFLYTRGYLGVFESPSFLPGAGEFFLLGIGSRFCCREFKPAAPTLIGAAALLIGYLAGQMAIAIWLAFLTYLCSRNVETKRVDRPLVKTADALFASRVTQWAGKRTYCVYLVHFPVFQLLLTLFTRVGLTSPDEVAGLLLLAGFPLTALAAEVVHRFVELPGMHFGKDVAGRLASTGASVAPRSRWGMSED